jgi:hypothetical protein
MACRYLSTAFVLVAACTASADRSASLAIAIDSSGHYPRSSARSGVLVQRDSLEATVGGLYRLRSNAR